MRQREGHTRIDLDQPEWLHNRAFVERHFTPRRIQGGVIGDNQGAGQFENTIAGKSDLSASDERRLQIGLGAIRHDTSRPAKTRARQHEAQAKGGAAKPRASAPVYEMTSSHFLHFPACLALPKTMAKVAAGRKQRGMTNNEILLTKE
jgi:hypothetical protein